ncbi:unnamed protein product [Tilletia controversa]|uniref:Expansin-like EG45 domain-containing protein n=3 Tax=Tilletia TaxID=13289 RepID=A0A8X7MKU5_9BASI|nr:hypothetical protein CF336_g7811 [Tilletia laevis]KAE8186138.1 hypothetical protein CF328_g7322 [Tilletia controversa]KAE8246581.1 hypothetical protein A4X03_0g7242 [Tilletia caries]KAE8187393.1 hypothetical protein CF335_g7187 [Tilletia laevis]KAE8239707.1 hypothetical protein A4X06_0g8087 [Tilletia controversa]
MTWRLPESGWATMTHYDLPTFYTAACGCVGNAPTMPSAALNVLSFGSETSFGPACGLCAKLTLISTPLADLAGQGSMIDNPNPGDAGIAYSEEEQENGTAPSIVVKVIDSCPLGPPHCNATVNGPNGLGSYVHFDLAWPSVAIPSDFFPGTHDYGVWNVSYSFVSCKAWRGYNNPKVVGSDWIQEDSACCPKDPPLPSDPAFNNTIFQSQVADRGMPLACPNYADTLLADPAMVPNTSNPLSKHDHDGPASTAGVAGAGYALRPRADGSSLAAMALWTFSLPMMLGIFSLPLLS